MGQIIQLADGKTATIMELKDVYEIIAYYCGYETRDVVRDCIRDLQGEKEDLELENSEYREEIENINETEREFRLEVRDEVDALIDELAESRLNRRKIQKIGKNIHRIVNAEL